MNEAAVANRPRSDRVRYSRKKFAVLHIVISAVMVGCYVAIWRFGHSAYLLLVPTMLLYPYLYARRLRDAGQSGIWALSAVLIYLVLQPVLSYTGKFLFTPGLVEIEGQIETFLSTHPRKAQPVTANNRDLLSRGELIGNTFALITTNIVLGSIWFSLKPKPIITALADDYFSSAPND